ncbi:MAG: aspartyl protease family protein [Sedimentisphaerales bacterium]|jgi:predicted aspartyl protease
MKRKKEQSWLHPLIAALLTIVIAQAAVFADRPGWQKEQADWQTGNGSRIKSISYPPEKRPPMAKSRRPQKPEKELIFPPATTRASAQLKSTADTEIVFANAIDSPAVDGFTPWIVISVTDERADSDTFDATTEYSIVGNYLTSHPESDYIIGIFDTGSSAHVMGYEAGNRAGIFAKDLLTSNTSTISGVTGSVDAWVSQPLAIFIDGLRAVEPNGMLWNRSKMVGQSNVAIMVGQGGSPVDLPTTIGSPMSVYFTTAFYNDTVITRTRDGSDYNSPDIRIYQQDDPCIPIYPNTIPMELRPLGATSVEYIPGLTGDLENPDFEPTSPSVIIGNESQSVFFVASVDLYKGTYSAIDKTRFMLDTGAQVSVVGSRVAARLGLKPAHPDFEVEIQGVTGDISTAPGFYIDAIDIPALGDWLSFTNIPVVLLDVSSPEGGTLDGIIGMNLFTDLNFTLRGGGMFLQDDPAIDYETISQVTGDINGDEVVDWFDVAAFADAWLATPESPNWNARADMVSDEIINFFDFAVMAQNWQ